LHIGGEDVEVVVPEPGRVKVSAKTSGLGPGYHIFLCDLLHRFGEARGVTWDPPGADGSHDDTRYFFTGDRAAVEAEMLKHLKVMAAFTTEMMDTKGTTGLMWSMPVGHHYDGFGPLVTLLGPRDRDWLNAVLADPRSGIDVYPWWEEGTGPHFLRNRALCEMWLNVRWRAPLNYSEQMAWENVHCDLWQAYEGDPGLNYPWREWLELLEYLEANGVPVEEGNEEVEAVVRERGAQATGGPLIGYRRRPVRVVLADGWSITIPGELAETWDDGLWKAWDQTRTVWFNWWRLEGKDGGKPSAEQLLNTAKFPDDEGGEWFDHHAGNLIGRAVLKPHEENGERLWNLCARSALAGRLALCNVFFRDEADRDWAIATWHSLTHPGDG
jgi:hypothetical protein